MCGLSLGVSSAMRAVLLAVALLSADQALAQAPAPPVDPQQEIRAATQAAIEVAQAGPRDIVLLDQAILKLPRGYYFVPVPQAGRLLQAYGNRSTDTLRGMVWGPGGPGGDWVAIVRFFKSGYIKDDDARDWNAAELLDSLRTGTEENNKERRARGLPEMEVLGWIEPPAYDAATHRLVWSLSSRNKGEPADAEKSVNYNTYALGRDGYISLNLVTGASAIERYKPVARELLASLEYQQGKRYADFNPATDRVAEFGLAALVGGAVAKKLGLFGLIGVFLLKFWKIVAIAVVALGGGAFQLFRRRRNDGPIQ